MAERFFQIMSVVLLMISGLAFECKSDCWDDCHTSSTKCAQSCQSKIDGSTDAGCKKKCLSDDSSCHKSCLSELSQKNSLLDIKGTLYLKSN